MHDWVGDLSLGANCRAEMNTENTIHCLGPEMAALFHVELLAYPYNPFPAEPGFLHCAPALALSQIPKNSCQGFVCTWQRRMQWGDIGARPPCAECSQFGANPPRTGCFHLWLWLILWG